jgi:transposase
MRIVAAHKSGQKTVKRIAETFSVCVGTVKKLVRQERKTGNLTPRKKGIPAREIWTDANLHKHIQDLVAEDNQATLAEYCTRVMERTGTRVSASQMCTLLQQFKLYRKKKLFARPKASARKSICLAKNGATERVISIRNALSSSMNAV